MKNNDILMYATYNEGKSVIAERLTKTLKAKIYKKKMAANNSKSHLNYQENLIGEKIIGTCYVKELLRSIL